VDETAPVVDDGTVESTEVDAELAAPAAEGDSPDSPDSPDSADSPDAADTK
jgi:hypothetical protein